MKLSDNTKVIIKKPFKGNAQTFVGLDGKVHYSDLTVEQYLAENPDCEVVTWEQFDAMHEAFNKHPLQPISAEFWTEKFEELPPLHYRVLANRYRTFFCSEPMSGIFHGFYVHDTATGKYYGGTKSRFTSDAQLLKEIESEISN